MGCTVHFCGDMGAIKCFVEVFVSFLVFNKGFCICYIIERFLCFFYGIVFLGDYIIQIG